MKVLLDEWIPRKLKTVFTDHECQTVPEGGLVGAILIVRASSNRPADLPPHVDACHGGPGNPKLLH